MTCHERRDNHHRPSQVLEDVDDPSNPVAGFYERLAQDLEEC
jgi:hypothetical protein